MKKRTWLVAARKERGLNQLTLSKEVGIAKSYLSAIENGERTPSGVIALRLSRLLDVPLEWFFEENQEAE